MQQNSFEQPCTCAIPYTYFIFNIQHSIVNINNVHQLRGNTNIYARVCALTERCKKTNKTKERTEFINTFAFKQKIVNNEICILKTTKLTSNALKQMDSKKKKSGNDAIRIPTALYDAFPLFYALYLCSIYRPIVIFLHRFEVFALFQS